MQPMPKPFWTWQKRMWDRGASRIFNYRGGHMGATKNIGVGHKKENLQFYYAVVKKERVLAVLVPSGAV